MDGTGRFCFSMIIEGKLKAWKVKAFVLIDLGFLFISSVIIASLLHAMF